MDKASDKQQGVQVVSLDVAMANALFFHRQGRLSEARSIYVAILDRYPTYADAEHLIAATLLQEGKAADALERVDTAMRLRPRQSFYHNTRAQALRALGRNQEALTELRTALDLMPQNAEAHFNLGDALIAAGEFSAAETQLRRALSIRPVFAQASAALSHVLRLQGDQGGAVPFAQLAAALEPRRVDFALSLAGLFIELGHFDLAEPRFKAVTEQDPENITAWAHLAVCQTQLNRRAEAIATYREAWRRSPQNVGVLDGLYEAMRQACDWSNLAEVEEAYVRLVHEYVEAGVAPPARGFTVLYSPVPTRDRLAVVRGLSAAMAAPFATKSQPRPSPSEAGRRIRLGYLSQDIKEHPTAHLIVDLFAKHDREKYEVFLYSTAPDDYSEFRKRIIGDVEHFVECYRMPDKDIAERIGSDGIDVLVDLMSHTRDNRFAVLARRPAPVQISYLVYPGTTGAEFIDYYVGDHYTLPASMDRQEFSESLIRLPVFYLVNSHGSVKLGEPPSRAACGLPERGVIYCCVNNSYKIDPFVFSIWCNILRDTSDSVLWMVKMTPDMEMALRREAQARGISGERLVFADRVERDAHLTRLQLADVFLDTRFYNAHTTALDALAAGVPVLTVRGERYAGRVAASALMHLQLPHMVVAEWSEYERTAIDLGRDAALRGKWKRDVEEASKKPNSLFATESAVRALETAYHHALERSRTGQPAADFDVEIDGTVIERGDE
jgi:predicted O-linked N-acetylglucosamine transferase (SPINDLY family)